MQYLRPFSFRALSFPLPSNNIDLFMSVIDCLLGGVLRTKDVNDPGSNPAMSRVLLPAKIWSIVFCCMDEIFVWLLSKYRLQRNFRRRNVVGGRERHFLWLQCHHNFISYFLSFLTNECSSKECRWNLSLSIRSNYLWKDSNGIIMPGAMFYSNFHFFP